MSDISLTVSYEAFDIAEVSSAAVATSATPLAASTDTDRPFRAAASFPDTLAVSFPDTLPWGQYSPASSPLPAVFSVSAAVTGTEIEESTMQILSSAAQIRFRCFLICFFTSSVRLSVPYISF